MMSLTVSFALAVGMVFFGLVVAFCVLRLTVCFQPHSDAKKKKKCNKHAKRKKKCNKPQQPDSKNYAFLEAFSKLVELIRILSNKKGK